MAPMEKSGCTAQIIDNKAAPSQTANGAFRGIARMSAVRRLHKSKKIEMTNAVERNAVTCARGSTNR